MRPGRVLILLNPAARRAPSEAALRAAAAPLAARGWRFGLQSTRGPGDAERIAAEAAADGCDAVLAVGGDGSAHEAANGLAGTATALGVVPAGTANVWAREAGVPRGAARALAFLEAARAVRVDLGRVATADGRERRFLLMCSAGLDAEVVRRLAAGGAGKRLLGRARYAAAGLAHGARAAPARATVEAGGERVEGDLLFAVAGNTRLYGGVARLTGAARADDGLLDVVAFTGRGLGDRLRLTARALRGGLDRRAGGGVAYLRAAGARIEAERPLAVQADGEYLGVTPAAIAVEPLALTVLIAPGPNPLIGGG